MKNKNIYKHIQNIDDEIFIKIDNDPKLSIERYELCDRMDLTTGICLYRMIIVFFIR